MRKSKITTVENGYDELFKDLFNMEHNTIAFNYEEGTYLIVFDSLEDKQQFFKLLTMFSVEPDVIELLQCRYGLNDGEAKTLKQLSIHLGITDEAIRNKIVRAQRKMKHKLNVRRTLELYNKERSDNIGSVLHSKQQIF